MIRTSVAVGTRSMSALAAQRHTAADVDWKVFYH
jgi:hypothetical protein